MKFRRLVALVVVGLLATVCGWAGPLAPEASADASVELPPTPLRLAAKLTGASSAGPVTSEGRSLIGWSLGAPEVVSRTATVTVPTGCAVPPCARAGVDSDRWGWDDSGHLGGGETVLEHSPFSSYVALGRSSRSVECGRSCMVPVAVSWDRVKELKGTESHPYVDPVSAYLDLIWGNIQTSPDGPGLPVIWDIDGNPQVLPTDGLVGGVSGPAAGWVVEPSGKWRPVRWESDYGTWPWWIEDANFDRRTPSDATYLGRTDTLSDQHLYRTRDGVDYLVWAGEHNLAGIWSLAELCGVPARAVRFAGEYVVAASPGAEGPLYEPGTLFACAPKFNWEPGKDAVTAVPFEVPEGFPADSKIAVIGDTFGFGVEAEEAVAVGAVVPPGGRLGAESVGVLWDMVVKDLPPPTLLEVRNNASGSLIVRVAINHDVTTAPVSGVHIQLSDRSVGYEGRVDCTLYELDRVGVCIVTGLPAGPVTITPGLTLSTKLMDGVPGSVDVRVVAPFTDISANHPFRHHIEAMAFAGLTTGYTDGTFRPTDALTRQAFIAFMWRLAGSPAAPGPSGFSDVPASHPFAEAIAWAAREGVSTGYADGTFRPGDVVSRQAMAAFLWRDAGSPSAPPPAFWDVPAGHSFAGAVGWAASTGVTAGYDGGVFRPTEPVSRQAAAAFLFRAYGY